MTVRYRVSAPWQWVVLVLRLRLQEVTSRSCRRLALSSLRVIAQIGHAVAHQLAGPKEPHQGDGIAAVGPDPITWLPRDQ